jgi:glutamate-1-semialdehyde 2,1-aminomutase
MPPGLDLDEAVRRAHGSYAAARPRSRALHERALGVLAGGNTRSVLDFSPFPFRVARAAGAELVDVDGHAYVDFCGNYTAGLLGHDPAAVRRAVDEALDGGWAVGAMHPREIELAELVTVRFPAMGPGAVHELGDRGEPHGRRDGGCRVASPGWLRELRRRCTDSGVVLVLDEVMTSRLSPGGAQRRYRITPDMTTLGKYLGGGMPFGAFGGREDVMRHFDRSAGGTGCARRSATRSPQPEWRCTSRAWGRC